LAVSSKVPASEWKRKIVHVGMGVFALALRWLAWPAAAAAAAAAVLFNIFAMPVVGRSLYRDRVRRTDPGIVAYPAMVLVLILLFRDDLAVAAAAWGMMALGDPAATIAGKSIGGPALAWNRRKTVAGFLAGALFAGAGAALLFRFVSGTFPPALACGVAATVYALAESLETGLDDNWIAPLPAALALFFLIGAPAGVWQAAVPLLGGRLILAFAVNAVVAAVAWRGGLVSLSGAVAGAVAGTLIADWGGWGAYGVLWVFFLLGTLATRAGYRIKEARGSAQADHGQRGAAHVAANCGLPAIVLLLGVVGGHRGPLAAGWGRAFGLAGVAFAAAFAAALADTLGTEVGSLAGQTAYSLTRFRRVPPGTRGAVSLEGTLAGVFGALLIAAAAALVGVTSWRALGAVTAGGVAGSLAESLLLDGAARRGIALDHEFVNLFNTFVGALVALEIAVSVAIGRLYVPFGVIGGAV
jgi:uncharacterized protein (TIGR00297 family)